MLSDQVQIEDALFVQIYRHYLNFLQEQSTGKTEIYTQHLFRRSNWLLISELQVTTIGCYWDAEVNKIV